MSRLFNSKKNIFYIHIPKCGGTSIRNTLGSDFKGLTDKIIRNKINDNKLNRNFNGDKSYYFESSLYDIMYDYFGDDIKNGFIFSCIRNPYKRFISLYVYFKNHTNTVPTNEKIDEFVDRFISHRKKESIERIEEVKMNYNLPRVKNRRDKYIYRDALSYHGDTFSQHLLDKNLNPKVDFICILERIQEDWKYIQEKTNVPLLSHDNKTKNFTSKDYMSIYTDKSYKFVEEFYKNDIEYYNNNFKT